MATEITCIVPADHCGIERVGGPGWLQDTETVIGEIEEGRRYYVRLGSGYVNVLAVEDLACPLRTDPAETPENELLNLPTCLLSLEHPR